MQIEASLKVVHIASIRIEAISMAANQLIKYLTLKRDFKMYLKVTICSENNKQQSNMKQRWYFNN